MDMKHSAYRSMQLAKQGKTKKKDGKLRRWVKEEWINLSPYLRNIIKKIEDSPPCGDSRKNKKGDKSICRPLKKVNQNTPKLATEYTKKQMIKAQKIKNKGKRIEWGKL